MNDFNYFIFEKKSYIICLVENYPQFFPFDFP